MKQNQIKHLVALIKEIAKSNSRFLYTEVPEDAVESIMKFGLLSAKLLINKKDLLKLSRPKKKDYDEFIKNTSASNEPFLKGPNAYIKPPPDDLELSPKHPSKRFKTIRVSINIDKLLDDEPDTKFYGLELTPFPVSQKTWLKMSKKEQDKLLKDLGNSRERFISIGELDELLDKSAEELWQNYDKASPLYAGDVPHVAIITPSGSIDKKYLKIEKT
jgi:hypothetical protein